MPESVYLLTTPLVKREYKIGHITGTKKDVCQRYSTYFPHGIKVKYIVEISNARDIEEMVKHHYKGRRVIFSTTGSESEWITAPATDIIQYIKVCIEKYGKK